MGSDKIAILYHPQLAKFDFGPGHPFRGERYLKFYEIFHSLPDAQKTAFEFINPPIATDNELKLVHTQEYIEYVKMLEKTGGYLSPDTYLRDGMITASKLIIGSGIKACELIMERGYKHCITFGGFHHASSSTGGGFCIFNDVAIVTKILLGKYKLRRVMIIDTDAHHGDGTMDIFYSAPEVLFVSLHQDPRTLYPGRGFVTEIGAGAGVGFTVNIPMPKFSTNIHYARVFDEIILPLVSEYQPEFIIRNGGADPHFADELTQLNVDLDGLYLIGSKVRECINRTTARKSIDMVASGYSELTPYGWLALIAGVTGVVLDYKAGIDEKAIHPYENKYLIENATVVDKKLRKVIESVKKELSPYWSSLKT